MHILFIVKLKIIVLVKWTCTLPPPPNIIRQPLGCIHWDHVSHEHNYPKITKFPFTRSNCGVR